MRLDTSRTGVFSRRLVKSNEKALTSLKPARFDHELGPLVCWLFAFKQLTSMGTFIHTVMVTKIDSTSWTAQVTSDTRLYCPKLYGSTIANWLLQKETARDIFSTAFVKSPPPPPPPPLRENLNSWQSWRCLACTCWLYIIAAHIAYWWHSSVPKLGFLGVLQLRPFVFIFKSCEAQVALFFYLWSFKAHMQWYTFACRLSFTVDLCKSLRSLGTDPTLSYRRCLI